MGSTSRPVRSSSDHALVSIVGQDLNRDTVGIVQKAGFGIRCEEKLCLDYGKII